VLLLDASFLIAFSHEEERRQTGEAMAFLRSRPGERTVVSLVAAGEFLEGVEDLPKALQFLNRYTLIGLSLPIARRSAEIQSRLSQRLGENDAWLAATAPTHTFTLVSSDRAFARVPRLDFIDFTKPNR